LLGQQVVYAKTSLWIGWLMGLLLTLGVVLGLFIYVNPHARFVSNRFPSIYLGARVIKTELYKDLNTPPDIIILGSSRAFTLSPEYLKKQTSHTAFNMAVEGARGEDYDIQLKYILAHGSPPQVLIIEISQNSFEEWDYVNPGQPFSLVPYMSVISTPLHMDGALRDSFSLQALSDSIYLLTMYQTKSRLISWSFVNNSLGIRKPVNPKQYQTLLQSHIKEFDSSMHCMDITNSISKHAFEDTLKVAIENNISIVLYESPMNSAFYDATYKSSPDEFDYCRSVIRGYLKSLKSKYPNIFFQDLSDDKKINNLEEDGFYDGFHLRPIAANMVIDALLPDIKSAIEWATEKREQKSP